LLFFRALVAFLALPVIVAGLLPWMLLPNDRWRIGGTLLGWPVLAFGACVLLWCVRDFYLVGKGTLAPWDPPKTLVIVGLYRFLRNRYMLASWVSPAVGVCWPVHRSWRHIRAYSPWVSICVSFSTRSRRYLDSSPTNGQDTPGA